MKAKVERKRVNAESHDDVFLHNPYKTTEIYFKDLLTGELIKLQLSIKDTDLPYECSITDVIDLMNRDALHLFGVTESRHQALSELEAGQEKTKNDAENAYQETLSMQEKVPSKASLKHNKKENRQQEKVNLLYGMPTPISNSQTSKDFLSNHATEKNKNMPPDSNTNMPLLAEKITSDGAHINEGSDNILLNAMMERRKRRNANV